MMACILFVLSLWGTICIRELRLNKQNLLYAVISYLFPLTVMISVIIISHKNIGFGSAAGIQVFYIYTSVLLFSASISLFYLLEKNILLDMSGEKSSVMEELLSLQRRHYERLDISQRELQSLGMISKIILAIYMHFWTLVMLKKLRNILRNFIPVIKACRALFTVGI